jgi:hypothetical protein
MSSIYKNIVIVLRGKSAAVIPKEDKIKVGDIPTKYGPAKIEIFTRWKKRENGIFFPGDICV